MLQRSFNLPFDLAHSRKTGGCRLLLPLGAGYWFVTRAGCRAVVAPIDKLLHKWPVITRVKRTDNITVATGARRWSKAVSALCAISLERSSGKAD